MMRILIPFVVALGLSLGITTGISMLRGRASASANAPQKPKADSARTTADNVNKSDAKHAATAQGIHAQSADSKDSTHVDPATSVATSVATSGAAPKNDAPKPTRSEADSGLVRIVAKTFSTMQPRAAANVLLQMEDNDVRIILSSMNAKQQGSILANFPAQRAAKLASSTLHAETQ